MTALSEVNRVFLQTVTASRCGSTWRLWLLPETGIQKGSFLYICHSVRWPALTCDSIHKYLSLLQLPDTGSDNYVDQCKENYWFFSGGFLCRALKRSSSGIQGCQAQRQDNIFLLKNERKKKNCRGAHLSEVWADDGAYLKLSLRATLLPKNALADI